MYVNKPARAAQPAVPETGHARAGSPAAALVDSASTAHASAVATAMSASAAIPTIPLHSLGGSSSAAADFVATPSDDIMSVVAGYLRQKAPHGLHSVERQRPATCSQPHHHPSETPHLFLNRYGRKHHNGMVKCRQAAHGFEMRHCPA